MRHVYLSPHLDDAVLSCGAAIAEQRAAGDEVEIVTACAGAPDPSSPLSPLALDLHRRWGLDATSVTRTRRTEDLAASAVLGATPVHLEFLEAIYRLPARYATFEALFAEADPDDPLPAELEDALCARLAPGVMLHAPLAIGGHVDHRLVHDVALRLASRGHPLRFFEDVPYVLRPGELERRQAELSRVLTPELVVVERVMMDKIRAIRCYRSQVATLFGSDEQMPGELFAYARIAAGELGRAGLLAERRWRLP